VALVVRARAKTYIGARPGSFGELSGPYTKNAVVNENAGGKLQEGPQRGKGERMKVKSKIKAGSGHGGTGYS
jgi:hypothetical protein